MKIFLSAVSAEFEQCRDELAHHLHKAGCTVYKQGDLQQGDKLIERLEEYVERCDRVIVLIGRCYGVEATGPAVPAVDPPRSYAQWEYFFALGERLTGKHARAKRMHTYLASDQLSRYQPVRQSAEHAERQDRFRQNIMTSDTFWAEFDNVDHLCAMALSDILVVPPQPSRVGRRSAIYLIGAGLVVATAAATELLHDWLTPSLDSKREALQARGVDPERMDILRHLLRPTPTTGYSRGSSRLENAAGQLTVLPSGSSQDESALAAFRCLYPVAPAATREHGEVALWPEELVVAGSPVAAYEARLYLPYYEPRATSAVSQTFRPKAIPYHFAISDEPIVRVISGTHGISGSMKRASANGLRRGAGPVWTPSKLVYPIGGQKSGLLRTDFLLVSRLPKGPSGGAVTILSGGHGAGTRSFELLLSEALPMPQLHWLRDALDEAKYFQFVLEAGEIEHKPGQPSAAHTLRVSEECPPERIEWTNPASLFRTL